MSFWQSLTESYEKNADVLGKIYPLSTTSVSNNGDIIAIIVIDGNGNFLRFDKIEKRINPTKKNPGNPLFNITIPVTEQSMGRSSGVAPHPVFDQYEYLKGSGNKYQAYILQLQRFAESSFATEHIKAIYSYFKKETLSFDLAEIEIKDKTNVIFQVEIPGQKQSKLWEDPAFFSAWHDYYLEIKNNRFVAKSAAIKKLDSKLKISAIEKNTLKEQSEWKDDVALDYITGEVQPIAIFHPKKISNGSANAKLISDNDKDRFTFRGKFENSSQAVSIGYDASQKAHQFLRYLINDRGCVCDEQIILSFTIGSIEEPLAIPIEEKNIYSILQENNFQNQNDDLIQMQAETGIDYAEALRKALEGYGYSVTLDRHTKVTVIALDAATTGRLSITFYRELARTEYLERIVDWHERCKWNQKFWDKKKEVYVYYSGAPALDTIIEAVYGKKRKGKDESYDKIKKAARERLLKCIFDGSFMPKDYVAAAVHRSSSPLSITNNGRFDRNGFDKILATTCALVRKDNAQCNKGDYKLSIDLERTDRDYLFGRLLGAADKLEEYALHKQGNDRVVTSAIRHMQAFAQRPFSTWQTIHSSLIPYIQKVKGSFAFNEIEHVFQLFGSDDYGKKNDFPLDGSYLIGYYHERAYIDGLSRTASEKKKSNKGNEKENSDER